MPVFVTGGTGFLGGNLVRLLVGRGQPVRLMVRPDSSRLGLDSDLIEFVGGDVTDAQSVRKAMAGCESVYHLAAWVQISPWGMQTARRVNVDGTRNVCAAALALGVKRMVHTSSIATMAEGTMDHPADESTPWNLRHLNVPYYVTKWEAEQVVQQHVKQGLDAVIVNPTYLVGPWDIKPSAGRALIDACSSRIRYYPADGGINFVDVGLAALGHLLAMKRGQTGERYILGGENLSYRTFCERIAATAGVTAKRIFIPNAVLYPGAALCSVVGRLFPSRFRDLNLSVLKSASLKHYVSSHKAVEALGFEETSVDQAVQDSIAWFVEHHYMKPPPNHVPMALQHTPSCPLPR